MNKIKSVAIRVKNHIARNKVAYAAGTVAVAAVYVQQTNKKAFEEFLAEKGIDKREFYFPELTAQADTPS